MKKKIIAAVTTILSVCMLGVGCQIHQSFGSLVPEEYGEWDNHYIYHGNVRSKTTGEDGEYLVTSVTESGKTYTVDGCADSAILGDDIYLCLNLSYMGENGAEIEYGLVKYNVKTKTQDLLLLEYTYQPEEGTTYVYRPYSIERVYEEGGLLLQGQREEITVDDYGAEQTNYQTAYFKVDYDGAFLEEIVYNTAGYSRVSDDYFTKAVSDSMTEEVTLYYITWGMDEGLPICSYDNANVYVECEFIDKNDVQGFLLKTYGLEDGTAPENYYGEKLKKVEFFNLAKNEIVSIFEGDTYVEWVGIPNKEYFITYEYDNVKYMQKSGMIETANEYTATVKKNCVLQHIIYSVNYVGLETAYIFNPLMGLQNVRGVVNDKELYISLEWYESAAGCNNGGYQSKQYKVDLEKGSLDTVKQEEWNNSQTICYGSYALKNGVSCGNYGYYIERIKLTTVYQNTSYAYRLQRYNSTDKQTDVMQLWKSSGSDEEEKYCQLMWRAGSGNLDEFIVRNY